MHAGGVPVNEGCFEALVIGASFGGPRAVAAILTALPEDFRVPVAVVQHTGPGMTRIWAATLAGKARVPIVEAQHRARFEAGVVHIAPAGTHIRLTAGMHGARINLVPGAEGEMHVPSVNGLFTSAARVFGSRTIAILLTGLGRDGAEGMLAVRQAGGYTIAESADTALSHSMPGSALKAGAVVEQLPLPAIADRVIELGGRL